MCELAQQYIIIPFMSKSIKIMLLIYDIYAIILVTYTKSRILIA